MCSECEALAQITSIYAHTGVCYKIRHADCMTHQLLLWHNGSVVRHAGDQCGNKAIKMHVLDHNLVLRWLSKRSTLRSVARLVLLNYVTCFSSCCKFFMFRYEKYFYGHIIKKDSIEVQWKMRFWMLSKAVFLNRWVVARYRALASIIPGNETFSWNLSF
jgi:hypothetical protein